MANIKSSVSAAVFGRFFILINLLSGSLTELNGQNLPSIEKKAIRSFRKGNMVSARDQFKMLYDAGYLPEKTVSYLAKSYIALYESSQAKKILAKLPRLNEEQTFLYAISNLQTENFAAADSLLRLVNDTSRFDLRSARQTLNKAQKFYTESKGFFVQNLGARVNTKDREYSAIMYNDYNQLVFTKRGEYGEDVDKDGLAYEMIYSTKLDSTENGEWQQAKPIQIDGYTADSHNATIQVYRSGTRLISYRDGDLFSHTLVDGVWRSDEELFLDGLVGNNTHCFVTEDEQTLFLASDFMSGGEQLDLFVLKKDSMGSWSRPEPILELNTEFDEDSPFLAKNGTFYFSSRGHNSMGGYDVFQSTYDSAAQKWTTPQNLGHPINSVAEDTYFNMDGKVGYLSSTREGGYGSLDIYRVFFFNKLSVAGQLLDSANNPISDAEVNINYDQTSLKTYTDENGAYELLVPVYKEMTLTFEKDARQLHEGEYIAHVFFKDKNDNSYNLYFENTEEDKVDLLNDVNQEVKHINIKVRNDYAENLILESVPLQDEMSWADSVNVADSVVHQQKVQKREEALLARVRSENLQINDVVIIKKVEESEKELYKEIQKETEPEVELDDKLFTIQILTMTIPNEPDPNYFDKLESRSVVFNSKGSDGFNRFYTGSYDSRFNAQRALRELKKLGYDDAFLRKIKKYKEL